MQTESKNAVLVVVGMFLAAFFGRSVGTTFFGPEWAAPFAGFALVTYLGFAHIMRDNWPRAALASLAALGIAVGLNYIRLQHSMPAYYVVLGLLILAAVVMSLKKSPRVE